MNRLFVATDFSERSDRAMRRATLLVRQRDAGITLIHVVDDDQPGRIVDSERDEAEQLLRRMAATLRDVDGVACEARVILASPFAGIIKTVEELAPDLLVIGPHRRQVLRDVFVGTTAERTIRSVQCPVLMVNAPPVGPYRHVLLTTDLSDGSREALQRFPALGLSNGVRHSLLYVFDAQALRLAFSHSISKNDQEGYIADEKKVASRALSGFVANAKLGNVRPVVRYEASAAQHEILKAADEEKADLIVLSTHGRTGLGKMLLGSVTEQVLRTSPVDVLAVPPPRQG